MFLLLSLHSFLRWVVLAALLYSIFNAYQGYSSNRKFTKADDLVRHWTATIAHIQLVAGVLLYTQSENTHYFWSNIHEAVHEKEPLFFGLIHISCMITAIIVITIGSALAKRRLLDRDKFKTMLVWFLLALLIIALAIPWPFSPLAHRPLIR